MNVDVLFQDVLAETFDLEDYINLPEEQNVMDYTWFLVTSDVYSQHTLNGGVGVSGYELNFIGRFNEPNEISNLLEAESSG